MKWLSAVNVLLGGWLIAAPFALGYANVHIALANDVILGIVVAGLALWRFHGPDSLAMVPVSLGVAAAGLWVLLAPYNLGYGHLTPAVHTDLVVGTALFLLGMWRGLTDVGDDAPHMSPHHRR